MNRLFRPIAKTVGLAGIFLLGAVAYHFAGDKVITFVKEKMGK